MQASVAPDFETKLSESYKAIPDGDSRLAGICGLSRLPTCFTTCNILNYIVQLFVSLAQYSLFSCSGLVQFFMVSLGGSPQQCSGEANC